MDKLLEAFLQAAGRLTPTEEAFLMVILLMLIILWTVMAGCRERAKQFAAEMESVQRNTAALTADRDALFDRLTGLLDTISQANDTETT